MNNRAAINYRGYWDVPRIFLTRHRGLTFLFDCAFDETLDDYPDFFKVYVLPDVRDEDLPKDWTTLAARATHYLGEVPLDRVLFDPSRRQSIDTAVLNELAARLAIAG